MYISPSAQPLADELVKTVGDSTVDRDPTSADPPEVRYAPVMVAEPSSPTLSYVIFVLFGTALTRAKSVWATENPGVCGIDTTIGSSTESPCADDVVISTTLDVLVAAVIVFCDVSVFAVLPRYSTFCVPDPEADVLFTYILTLSADPGFFHFIFSLCVPVPADSASETAFVTGPY